MLIDILLIGFESLDDWLAELAAAFLFKPTLGGVTTKTRIICAM
jgi:hypothetical protein